MGAEVWQDLVKCFLLQLLMGCPWSEEDSKAKFCLICVGDVYSGFSDEQNIVTAKMKEGILEAAADAVTAIRYFLAICRLMKKVQLSQGIYKKSADESETQKYWVASIRRALQSMSQLMNPNSGVLAKYIAANGSSSVFSSSEHFATIAEEDESAELLEDPTLANARNKLRMHRCRKARGGAAPLTHGLTRCVLSFAEQFFSFGQRFSKFFEQDWSLFYIRTHYLSFVKLYTLSTCADEGSATLRLASGLSKLHLRCLISIARNRSEEASRDFFRFHCVEFLAREIDLEYKMSLRSSALSSGVPGREEASPKQEGETPKCAAACGSGSPNPFKSAAQLQMTTDSVTDNILLPAPSPSPKKPKFKLSLDLSKLGFRNSSSNVVQAMPQEKTQTPEQQEAAPIPAAAGKATEPKKSRTLVDAPMINPVGGIKPSTFQAAAAAKKQLPVVAPKSKHFSFYSITNNPVLRGMLLTEKSHTVSPSPTNVPVRKSRTISDLRASVPSPYQSQQKYPKFQARDTRRKAELSRLAKLRIPPLNVPLGRSVQGIQTEGRRSQILQSSIRPSKTFTTVLSPRPSSKKIQVQIHGRQMSYKASKSELSPKPPSVPRPVMLKGTANRFFTLRDRPADRQTAHRKAREARNQPHEKRVRHRPSPGGI